MWGVYSKMPGVPNPNRKESSGERVSEGFVLFLYAYVVIWTTVVDSWFFKRKVGPATTNKHRGPSAPPELCPRVVTIPDLQIRALRRRPSPRPSFPYLVRISGSLSPASIRFNLFSSCKRWGSEGHRLRPSFYLFPFSRLRKAPDLNPGNATCSRVQSGFFVWKSVLRPHCLFGVFEDLWLEFFSFRVR